MPVLAVKYGRAAACLVCLLVAGLFAPPARADLAQHILKCFHPTAQYVSHQNRGDWPEASDYGAKISDVFDIDFKGYRGKQYTMTVVFLVRTVGHELQYRGEILNDSSVVPANDACKLNDWSSDEE